MPLTPLPTKLTNISFCRYWKGTENRTEDQWRASRIVRSIKGESFNGSVILRVNGSQRTLTADNAELATEWFTEKVAQFSWFDPAVGYHLVPMPDSKCVPAANRSSHVLPLAVALRERIPQLNILDILRFSHEMPSSRESKMRNEDVLYAAMLLTRAIPKAARLILLDDVCTTGAHAKAAARKLRQANGFVSSALSVARTTQDPADSTFGFFQDPL